MEGLYLLVWMPTDRQRIFTIRKYELDHVGLFHLLDHWRILLHLLYYQKIIGHQCREVFRRQVLQFQHNDLPEDVLTEDQDTRGHPGSFCCSQYHQQNRNSNQCHDSSVLPKPQGFQARGNTFSFSPLPLILGTRYAYHVWDQSFILVATFNTKLNMKKLFMKLLTGFPLGTMMDSPHMQHNTLGSCRGHFIYL